MNSKFDKIINSKNVQNIISSILIQISTMVESTFGPNGKYIIITPKIMNDGNLKNQKENIKLSNNTNYLLNNIPISHPVGAIIVKLSKNQFMTCGDGTTGVILLLNELHKECLILMDLGLDTTYISSILLKYSKILIEKLKSLQFSILKEEIPKNDLLNFKIHPDNDLLFKLCFTVTNTKLNQEISKKISNACIDCMNSLYRGLSIKELRDLRININNIQLIFKKNYNFRAESIKGFSIVQTTCENGLNEDYISYIKNCRILYLNDELKIKEQKNIQLEFNSAKERLNLLKGEKQILEKKLDIILNSKCDVIISTFEISNKIKYELNDIIIISNISQSTFEKSVKSLNGNIIDDLLSVKNLNEKLSSCDELIIENEDGQSLFKFKSESSQTCSIIINSPTKYSLDLIRDCLVTCLCVIRNSFEDCLLIPSGGGVEIFLSNFLSNLIIEDIKEKKIVDSFSKALEVIPRVLLKNNGFDWFEDIEKWKNVQKKRKDSFYTFDLNSFPIEFIESNGFDSLRVKIQQIHLSIETLSVLLNLDGIIQAQNLNQQEQEFDISLENERDWKYERLTTSFGKNWTKEKKLKYKNNEEKFYEKQKEYKKKQKNMERKK
eukprot:gene2922-4761_t